MRQPRMPSAKNITPRLLFSPPLSSTPFHSSKIFSAMSILFKPWSNLKLFWNPFYSLLKCLRWGPFGCNRIWLQNISTSIWFWQLFLLQFPLNVNLFSFVWAQCAKWSIDPWSKPTFISACILLIVSFWRWSKPPNHSFKFLIEPLV